MHGEKKEFAASMIIFLGAVAAIIIAAVAAIFVPSEQEFVQMGYSPITRYSWIMYAIIIPIGVSVLSGMIFWLRYPNPPKKPEGRYGFPYVV
jgi:uncharacterized BrkB/YihY/UPF0761 family membrane protein